MGREYLCFVVVTIAGPSGHGDGQNKYRCDEQRWLPARECFFYRSSCFHLFLSIQAPGHLEFVYVLTHVFGFHCLLRGGREMVTN